MNSACPLVLVREATPDDRSMIVELNRRLALETENKTLDPAVLDLGVAMALAEPDRARYWVAEWTQAPERQVVGQTAITREWSDWRNGWIWWLQSVYVVAEWRGRGVFRALHRHICQEAIKAQAIGLRLYVENENHRAQQTYQALGMKPGGYSVLEELWLAPSRQG